MSRGQIGRIGSVVGKAHSGLEFRQASISDNSLLNPSQVASWEPSVFRRLYFIGFSTDGHNSSKCGPWGGMTHQPNPSAARKSGIVAIGVVDLNIF